jgi:hypothetical protein
MALERFEGFAQASDLGGTLIAGLERNIERPGNADELA